MEQKTIRIENSELTARLFGSFDINVRMLERAFDVRIQNRSGDEGDAVIISGEDPENIAKAADAVRYLKNMAKYNEALTEQQVGYVVDMVNDGKENELDGYGIEDADGNPANEDFGEESEFFEAEGFDGEDEDDYDLDDEE